MDKKPKCPICQGLGFKDGKICSCIGKKDDPPQVVKDIFEMLGVKK